MFNANQSTNFSVLEVGMDKKGEINYLTKLIKPNLGLITNISYAHIENFKNLKEIAKAKGEIINNIISHGIIVLNMDSKYYKYFLKKSENRNLKIISFSKYNKNADILYLNKKKIKNRYLLYFKINGVKKIFFNFK